MRISELFAGVDVASKSPVLRSDYEWWLTRFAIIEFRPYHFCKMLVEDVPYEFGSRLANITAQRYAEFEIVGRDHENAPPYETSRAFDLNSGCLFQGFLDIREDLQSRGFGTTFARNCFYVAIRLGLSRLRVTAVDGGSYFWARAGFLSTEEQWNEGSGKDAILEKLDELDTLSQTTRARVLRHLSSDSPISLWALADERTLVDSSRNPGYSISLGRALLAESGATWRGSLEFDTHEFYEQQHSRFSRYILGNAP